MNNNLLSPRSFVNKLQLGYLDIYQKDADSYLNLFKTKDIGTLIEHVSNYPAKASDSRFTSLINKSSFNNMSPLYNKTIKYILVSHQPTLLPYSGVYVQFILASFLVSQLRKAGTYAKTIWICLDLDDSFDRRIRNSHLQNYYGRRSTTVMRYPIDKSYKNIAQYSVPFYGNKVINAWKNQIDQYMNNSIDAFPQERSLIKELKAKTIYLLEDISSDIESSPPNSFSSFSTRITCRFLELLGLEEVNVVFFSEIMNFMNEIFYDLLNMWPLIKSSAIRGIHALSKYGIDTNTMSTMLRDPFWIVCDKCGYRNTANHEVAKAYLDGVNINACCSSCSQNLIQGHLSPKVLIEDIATTIFCSSALTLTYLGSAPHVLLSSYVLKDLFGILPPIYSWHPKQILDSTIAFPFYRSPKGMADSIMRETFWRNLGRDSMLLAADVNKTSDLKILWNEHFLSHNYIQPMTTTKGAMLYEIIKNS